MQLTGIEHRDAGDTLAPLWTKKWSIVFRGDADCDQRCSEDLYLTRQVHVRLDKDANRVQRIYLHESPNLAAPLQALIDTEHRYLQLVSVKSLATLDSALEAVPGARFVLVDPDGWAMMAYDDRHQGEDLLTDLKHLLKFSRSRQ